MALSDNEIIKALEDKIEFQNFDENGYAVVDIEKLENTLDLINRLQAENKKNENIIRLADKTIKAQSAELERLKEENARAHKVIPKMIKTAKAEAIKEYNEAIKEYVEGLKDYSRNTLLTNRIIDNFTKAYLKEMVGDNDESC